MCVHELWRMVCICKHKLQFKLCCLTVVYLGTYTVCSVAVCKLSECVRRDVRAFANDLISSSSWMQARANFKALWFSQWIASGVYVWLVCRWFVSLFDCEYVWNTWPNSNQELQWWFKWSSPPSLCLRIYKLRYLICACYFSTGIFRNDSSRVLARIFVCARMYQLIQNANKN